MKPYIKIILTEEQRDLAKKTYATSNKHHIRQKSQALLLSDSGKIVTQIADILSFDEETIRTWFSNWKKEGFDSFEIKKGRGLKPKLSIDNVDAVALVKKSSRKPTEYQNIIS